MLYTLFNMILCQILPFATRCVMSVSPRLIGPPPIDLVLGRLGDDTPTHQASSLSTPRTTTILANSMNYRIHMSRACITTSVSFHNKTSLPSTLLSTPLQSLKSSVASFPSKSQSGTPLPHPSDHLRISSFLLHSTCFSLTPLRTRSHPDDLKGSDPRHTNYSRLGRLWKFKFQPNPIATPPVAATLPLHWLSPPLLQGHATITIHPTRVLLLSSHTTGNSAAVDLSLSSAMLQRANGLLLSCMNMLLRIIIISLSFILSLKLPLSLLLSLLQLHIILKPSINSIPLLNSFLLLLSLLLQLLLLLLLLTTARVCYCLLLMYCCSHLIPLPPIHEDESDSAPGQDHTRSHPFSTNVLRIHLLPFRQETHNRNHLPWRSSQVRYLYILPVLSQRLPNAYAYANA